MNTIDVLVDGSDPRKYEGKRFGVVAECPAFWNCSSKILHRQSCGTARRMSLFYCVEREELVCRGNRKVIWCVGLLVDFAARLL